MPIKQRLAQLQNDLAAKEIALVEAGERIEQLKTEAAARDAELAQAQSLLAEAQSETGETVERLRGLVETPAGTVHIAWLKLALAERGELDMVNAAVDQAGAMYRLLWDYATSIRKTDPEVVAIGTALNLDLDAIFARADEIRIERSQEKQTP